MIVLMFVAEVSGQRVEIVDMGDDGFAVLRYEGNDRTSTTHDFLQDDLESAMECAEEEFGIHRDDWMTPDKCS